MQNKRDKTKSPEKQKNVDSNGIKQTSNSNELINHCN